MNANTLTAVEPQLDGETRAAFIDRLVAFGLPQCDAERIADSSAPTGAAADTLRRLLTT